MDFAFGVVPVDGDSYVSFAIPFSADVVKLFKDTFEVFCMLRTYLLDSNVINY